MAPHNTHHPVAIIGIGCRFPGGVNSPESLWNLLIDGVDAITPVPEHRKTLWRSWGIDDTSIPGWGGFIDHVDTFDAAFFSISPREAKHIDPQQRLLLEVAYEALADGGQPPERLTGSATGVFIGIFLDEYWDLVRYGNQGLNIDAYTNTGGTMSVAANRISYTFDFRGPSLSVDTACSSSLVAVHLACQSLRTGECGLALAGGVNLLLSPNTSLGFKSASMLSPDGRCKAFDARADGYVRSEGAGLVLLKPLDAALSDGDSIYAVIRGSAINQDGRTHGITAPDEKAQEAMLLQACRNADVRPDRVRFVEMHGTGTSLGDPIEAKAVGHTLGMGRSTGDECVIGSIKTNIGHTEGASGVAGLIKAALVLKKRSVPPNLHFLTPHPDIAFDELRLRVAARYEALLEAKHPIFAGVNSFGFGGTNAHVVLEEAPIHKKHKYSSSGAPALLPISAKTDPALQDYVKRYADMLSSSPDVPFSHIAATAGKRRSHYAHRLAVVEADHAACLYSLNAYLQHHDHKHVFMGTVGEHEKLVFLYTGMGPQWQGMGKELLATETIFHDTLSACDDLFRRYASWSILEAMQADPDTWRMQTTEVAQAANFALQIGLSALWRHWGITPAAVIGHSVGEIAAAHIAGVLSLEDAVRITAHRGKVLQRTAGQGSMLAVGLCVEEAAPFIQPFRDEVAIASVNSPVSVTLSGPVAALEAISKRICEKGFFCKRLDVDVPYHGPMMEPLRDAFLEGIAGISPRPAGIPFISTVTGDAIDGGKLTEAYWWRNIREPARLDTAIAALIEEGGVNFLQIGPHPVLSMALIENLSHMGRAGRAVASLTRGEPDKTSLLKGLAELYTSGYDIQWDHVDPEPCTPVNLPLYPWQRELYWLDDTESRASVFFASTDNHGRHPVLGTRRVSSLDNGAHTWEKVWRPDSHPAVQDHRIRGACIMPAALYIEMILAAAGHKTPAPIHLEGVAFSNTLNLTPRAAQRVQVVCAGDMSRGCFCRISSTLATTEDTPEWITHATASVTVSGMPPREQERDIESIRARNHSVVPHDAFYTSMAVCGLEYGACYRSIDRIWYRQGEAIGRLRPLAIDTGPDNGFMLNPAIWDAAFQVAIKTLSRHENETLIPVEIGSISIHRLPETGDAVWVHAVSADAYGRFVDIALLDGNGAVLIHLRGLRVKRFHSTAHRNDNGANLFNIEWDEIEIQQGADYATDRSWICFLHQNGFGADIVERLSAAGYPCITVNTGDHYTRTDRHTYQLNPSDPDHLIRLFNDIGETGLAGSTGIAVLWALDDPSLSDFSEDAPHTDTVIDLSLLIQAIEKKGVTPSPRLRIITSNARVIHDRQEHISLNQSMLSGLSHVIVSEHPDLNCSIIDVDRDEASLDLLSSLLDHEDTEPESAIRRGIRYAPRLRPVIEPPNPLQHISAGESHSASGHENTYMGLEIPETGRIENLAITSYPRRNPGIGEVEIRVRAAGLNFRDVMSAMGLLPPDKRDGRAHLGWECAGIVTATGDGVSHLKPGDRVLALTDSCFAMYTITHTSLVAPIPDGLTFEEGATLPIAYLTAYYALVKLGSIQKNERVLIHSASGGVGLAALQIARRIGATIFATAGNDKKRAFLLSLGVQHVMDSRSLDFSREIRRITDGRGVDVVLNTLSGRSLQHSLSIIAPYGRFLELGKTDILNHSLIDLGLFERNISYHAIDMAQFIQDHPEEAGRIFRDCLGLIARGHVSPLPYTTYTFTNIKQAFQDMFHARHIGKIIVSCRDRDLPEKTGKTIRSDATYLITGGLGALGLKSAEWLADRGARHIVLAGRRKPEGETGKRIEAIRSSGVSVKVKRIDITQAKQIERLLHGIESSMPALKGVIHAAGVLDDGLLNTQTHDRFERVLAPKAVGAWLMHKYTRNYDLDFFFLYSSVSSLWGTAGQGNYAAANAFLDGLAQYRRLQKLPCCSINWGPWYDGGMASETLNDSGGVASVFKPIQPTDGEHILDRILETQPVQICAISIHEGWPGEAPPLFSQVWHETGKTGGGEPAPPGIMIDDVDPANRRSRLESYLREMVAMVSELNPEAIELSQSWRSLGIDSLMAVELKNRIESSLRIVVPVGEFQAEKSIAESASGFLEKMDAKK